MKTLLFIQGIYDTIDLFTAAFSDAFRKLGCVCHVIDIREKEEAMSRLKRLTEEERISGIVTLIISDTIFLLQKEEMSGKSGRFPISIF